MTMIMTDDDDKIEKVIREYEEYAKESRFSLNPNQKLVKELVKILLEKEKKFGARYCPCRRITGKEKEDKKIICPCAYQRKEIEKYGRCLCNLFVKS